jgi:hypothetical protein
MNFIRELWIGALLLSALVLGAAVVGALAPHGLPDAQVDAGTVPRSAPVAPAARTSSAAPSLDVAAAAAEAEAGASLRTRSGHAVDLRGDDVAAFIARRSVAARTGDARAAYEVYQAASLCAAAEPPLPDFEMAAERRDAEAERRHVRALCARVSPAQVQERMAFLVRAAQAGSRAAQIDFFMEGPEGRAPDVDGGIDEWQLRAWREQALGFLRQAGARCDAFALSLLSNAYDLGQLAPRDAAAAMTYAIAATAARGSVLPSAQLQTRFSADLAPAEFEAALQAGAALARQACPPGR